MVFEGVDISREQFLELKDLGAVKLPPSSDGRNSRVYYLNEQLDQSQTQTLVDDMYQTILQIVGMPSQGNANSSDSSTNGAVILKNGWWNAEARSLETQGMWKASETEFLKIILKICDDSGTLSDLKVSDLEPKFWRQSYENLLVKTQSFSTLRSAGAPAVQAFSFSHLSRDPESDAMLFDAYQEECAAQKAEVSATAAKPEVSDTPSTRQEDPVPDDPPTFLTGTCPVCGLTFQKRTGSQVYDRKECRQKARRGR
jgi:hypothetical protein